jgi:hypothetical protein
MHRDQHRRTPFGVVTREERLSEFFDFERFPEKATRKVTRAELLALLTREWAVRRDSRWSRRLWRWLTSKLGSGPLVVPQPPEHQ